MSRELSDRCGPRRRSGSARRTLRCRGRGLAGHTCHSAVRGPGRAGAGALRASGCATTAWATWRCRHWCTTWLTERFCFRGSLSSRAGEDAVLGRLLRAQDGAAGPTEFAAFLRRCFTCRVRCLLDSTSGFLVSEWRGSGARCARPGAEGLVEARGWGSRGAGSAAAEDTPPRNAERRSPGGFVPARGRLAAPHSDPSQSVFLVPTPPRCGDRGRQEPRVPEASVLAVPAPRARPSCSSASS